MLHYLIHERKHSAKRRIAMLISLLLADVILALAVIYGSQVRILGVGLPRLAQLVNGIIHAAAAMLLLQEAYSALSRDYDYRSDVLSHLIPITGLQAIGAKLLSVLISAGVIILVDSGMLILLHRAVGASALARIGGLHPQLVKFAGLGGFQLLTLAVAALLQLAFALSLLFLIQSMRRARFSRLTGKSLIASGAIHLIDSVIFLITFTFSGLVISLINRATPWLISLKHLAIIDRGTALLGNGMYLWFCVPVAQIARGNGLFPVTACACAMLTIFMLLGAAYLYDERIDY